MPSDEASSGCCIILAAGQGRRMGGKCKATTEVHGKMFLEHILTTLDAVRVSRSVVISGAPEFQQQIEDACKRLDCEVSHNSRWHQGMATSVAHGVDHIMSSDAQWLLLWPVDVPLVSPSTVKKVLSKPDNIVIPCFGGRGGHPTLFRRAVWNDLELCDSLAQGAKSVIQQSQGNVLRVPVDDKWVIHDFDTPL